MSDSRIEAAAKAGYEADHLHRNNVQQSWDDASEASKFYWRQIMGLALLAADARTPISCYWDMGDLEHGFSAINEITESYIDGSVHEVAHVSVVRYSFEARLPPSPDSESDDDFEVSAGNREDAERIIANEIKRRSLLEDLDCD